MTTWSERRTNSRPATIPVLNPASSKLSTSKAFGAVRRRIAEWRGAGHHLGNEPSVRRPERQAPVAVTIGEREAALARSAPDDRTRIGRARARAHPWLRLDRLPERKQIPRLRQQKVELHRSRRCIARRKFGTGGNADALLHWGDAVAVFGIEHWPA